MIARTPLSEGPGARDANPRSALNQRPDDGICGELGQGLVEVDVEVRDAARPLDDVDELLPVRQVRSEQEVVVASRRELEHTRARRDDDRPAVCPTGDVLDARYGAGGEVPEHRVPVQRSVKRQPEDQASVGDEPIGHAPAGTELAGRCLEHVLAGPVELAQAPEARRERDLQHAEIGVVQEPAGEVRAAPSAPARPASRRGGS